MSYSIKILIVGKKHISLSKYLAETQEEWDCPNAIKEDTKWGGHEEIRLMDIDDLIAIHDYYLNELEELGNGNLPSTTCNLMTSEQKTKCKLNIQENN